MVFQPSASPFVATTLHALAASSKTPQLLLDNDLNVIAASTSFCKAFKIKSINATGRPLTELGAGEWNVPQLLSLLKFATSGLAEIEGYEMALARRDRVTRRLILHAKRLQYGEERKMRLCLWISDVTDARIAEKLKEDLALERRMSLREARRLSGGDTLLTSREAAALKAVEAELRQKLEDQNEALVTAHADRQSALEAAQARAAFLTNTSHELRTPLNAVLGFSELIMKEIYGPIANDRYREYAEIIHKSGNHLLNLVNDLLDLSKLDVGKLELHFEPIEVLKVIIDCVRSVETQATKSHVGIAVTLHDGVNFLHGDDRRLHQILLNLLSNAIKFTPEGGEIRICAFRRGAAIAISVSDTGIGIKPDDLSKVFEPFGQVDSALGRKHEGTGLGLALTKELTELHGGSLSIESAEDVGTTVTVLLPLELGDAISSGGPRNRRQTAAIHRMVHSEKNPLDDVLTVISRSKA